MNEWLIALFALSSVQGMMFLVFLLLYINELKETSK